MDSQATGRMSADVVGLIREDILTGRHAPGRYLPPTRALGVKHEVCFETVRRALKVLEREGFLEAIPRHGFKVKDSAALPVTTCPVAYLTYFRPDLSDAHPVNLALDRALKESAVRRGWTMLSVHSGNNDSAHIAQQLSAARTWGVILDAVDASVLDMVRQLQLPVVMTNSWFENIDVDAVVQDNYRGGFQAAAHLLSGGSQRVAWIGSVGQNTASRERFAGVVAGLAAAGKELPTDRIVDASKKDAAARIKELFCRKDRPDAACVFWDGPARKVRAIVDELGIHIGSELNLVGWSGAADWTTGHARIYTGTQVPPAVVWDARDMAEAALDRLEARRKGLAGCPLRINVPTRIGLGE